VPLPTSRKTGVNDSRKPNVLLIVMDDQRADTLSGFEGPRPRTPNLDALVARGTSFRNTFVTVPICTPGRAELLSGCNPFETGVPWFGMPVNPGLTLMPAHFQANGYHTFFVGKWHNDGHPSGRGFARTRRVFGEENLNDYGKCGHRMRFREGCAEVEGHSTELFTDAAIKECRFAPGDRPWFGMVAYHSPHDPFDAPPPFDTLYPPEEVPLPEDYAPEAPADNGDMTIRDELLLPWPRTQAEIKRYRARYWQMITHHDHHIGRLLDELEASGQGERTLVVFVSDHGLAVGSHGLLGKENMYDHSCRVPWVLAGPGVPQGRLVDDLASSRDLFPTVAELCGLAVPSGVSGRSHAGNLRGDVATGRDFVVTAFCSPGGEGSELRQTQRAIRTRDWKLAFYPLSRRYELYHLANDPLEMNQLLTPWRLDANRRWRYQPPYEAEAVLARAESLRARLLEWQRRHGDPAAEAVAACGVKESCGRTSEVPVMPVTQSPGLPPS